MHVCLVKRHIVVVAILIDDNCEYGSLQTADNHCNTSIKIQQKTTNKII